MAVACLVGATLIASSCARGDDDASEATASPEPTTVATPTTAVTPDAAASATSTTAGSAATDVVPPATVAQGAGMALTASDIAEQCASEPLEATEVGVSESEITIQVMADTGSQLSPGFGQGSVDAINGFADYINANGGIGCRQVVVRTWDSKFDPSEAKNGQIDACANALAMVGNYSVLNPDPTPMEQCVDQAGVATGIPNVAALAVDGNENCSPMSIGVNSRPEPCPLAPDTEREFRRMIGPVRYLLSVHPDLHGIYLGNSDLPSTRLSAVPDILALQDAGLVWDAKLLQSARDEQSAYIPRVQYLKTGSNFVWNTAADYALVLWRKEAIAQGVDMDSITWSCGVACYTSNLLEQGGAAVEGQYVWIPFLPFEEADTNAAVNAYVTSVADGKIDYNGAQSWQAAIAFQQAVNQIVMADGPNAITRANLLTALNAMDDFSADGMTGPHGLSEVNPCFVMVQVQDGAFVRVWPKDKGTLDCDPNNIGTVTVNPEQTVETVFTNS